MHKRACAVTVLGTHFRANSIATLTSAAASRKACIHTSNSSLSSVSSRQMFVRWNGSLNVATKGENENVVIEYHSFMQKFCKKVAITTDFTHSRVNSRTGKRLSSLNQYKSGQANGTPHLLQNGIVRSSFWLNSQRSHLSKKSFSTVRLRFPQRNSKVIVSLHSFTPIRLFASNQKKDYYQLLGVSSTATPTEIKHAYYRAAKACHPDLFPDDPKASAKFRDVSEAFETLSDPVKRSNYDAARAHGNYYAQEPQDQQYTDTQAREAFEGLFHDVGIVLEALGYYILRTKDDVADAANMTVSGNWTGLWDIIKSRPYVFGSFIPLLLVLRFPQLAIGAGVAGGSIALRVVSQILLRNPHHAMDIGSQVWKQIVQLAHQERNREIQKQTRGRKR